MDEAGQPTIQVNDLQQNSTPLSSSPSPLSRSPSSSPSPAPSACVSHVCYLPNRLAAVEVALIFHFCDYETAFSLLKCNHLLHRHAQLPFCWKYQPSFQLKCDERAISNALSSSLFESARIPLSLVQWSDSSAEPDAAEKLQQTITQFSALKCVREIDLTDQASLTDDVMKFLSEQANLQRSVRQLRLGGRNHRKATDRGFKTLCQTFTQLESLSIDYLRPEHEDNGEADAESDESDLFYSLIALPQFTKLQVTRVMAEELTPASLRNISKCLQLQSLFLENLEAFDSADLFNFFSSPAITGLRQLTLSFVVFNQPEMYYAFYGDPDHEHSSDGAARGGPDSDLSLSLDADPNAPLPPPGRDPVLDSSLRLAEAYPNVQDAPRDGLFDAMTNLTSLSLIHCRGCYRLLRAVKRAPNLKRLVVRGRLDSWGVELPKRDEMLSFLHGLPDFEELVIFAQSDKLQDIDNYRAQISAVEKVKFFNGSLHPNNPDRF